MATSVHIWGLDKLIKFTDGMSKRKNYDKVFREMIEDAAQLTRNFAPVSTGRLEESIKVVKIDNNRYEIVVDIPYAIFQEYGTKYINVGTPESPKSVTSKSGKMSYRPFLRPAIWIVDADFAKYIKKVLIYAEGTK